MIKSVFKQTEVRLRVHRCILGLHSPVFRQMFSNDDMQEARTGQVTINDHSVEAVRYDCVKKV